MTDTARRRCDFCKQPAESLTTLLDIDDPTSPRVALDHDDCYRAFMTLLWDAQRAAWAAAAHAEAVR